LAQDFETVFAGGELPGEVGKDVVELGGEGGEIGGEGCGGKAAVDAARRRAIGRGFPPADMA
jgi:hypothetical protein